jgi:predicted DNA-binding protein with PD1-like motif
MQISSGPITAHSIRLTPGQDLVPALEYAAAAACHSSACGAAFILTAVGSLSNVTLRLASAHSGGITSPAENPMRTWNEPVEVTSLVGTMAISDDFIIAKHWHMSIADEAGDSFGGHVMAATVWTTMEIVLGTIGNGVSFSREMDSATGYRELVVRQQPPLEGEGREEEKETKQQEITEEGNEGKPSWMAKLKKMKVKVDPVEPEKETSQPGWQMRNMLKKKRDMEAGIIESGRDEDEESTEDEDDEEDDENDVWANVNMKKPGIREGEVANDIVEPNEVAFPGKKGNIEIPQDRWNDDSDNSDDSDWSDVKQSKKKDNDDLSLSSHSAHSLSSRSSKRSNDKDLNKSTHHGKDGGKEKKSDKKSDKKDKETPEEKAKRKAKEKESKAKDKGKPDSDSKKDKGEETPEERAKRKEKEKDKKSAKKDKKSDKKSDKKEKSETPEEKEKRKAKEKESKAKDKGKADGDSKKDKEAKDKKKDKKEPKKDKKKDK